jgi:hypothetical protein
MSNLAIALKVLLRKHEDEWVREGSADTEGFGDGEWIDWESLDKQIDEFCAEFEAKR